MDNSTLKARVRRAAGWPLRRALDPRLEGLRNELNHNQELNASATQESMEALAVGIRLLRGTVLELAEGQQSVSSGALAADEGSLLRAAALGAVAASGARRALSVGHDVSADLAAFGILIAERDGDDPVDLVVAISGDLAESVPLDRLAAGGTLVLAVGRVRPAGARTRADGVPLGRRLRHDCPSWRRGLRHRSQRSGARRCRAADRRPQAVTAAPEVDYVIDLRGVQSVAMPERGIPRYLANLTDALAERGDVRSLTGIVDPGLPLPQLSPTFGRRGGYASADTGRSACRKLRRRAADPSHRVAIRAAGAASGSRAPLGARAPGP